MNGPLLGRRQLVRHVAQLISRSLALQLSLSLVLLTCAFVLLQSALIGHLARQQVVSGIGDQLVQRSAVLANGLDRSMFERFDDMQKLASLPVLRDHNSSQQERRQGIEQLQTRYPVYTWIGLTDTSGRVVASTERLLEGQDVSQQPWFQGAQRTPFIGDVHESPLLDHLIDLAVPVFDEAGVLRGVLGAQLNWAWAQEVRGALGAPIPELRREEVLIVRADGQVILGPGPLLGQVLKVPSVVAAQQHKAGFHTENWPDGVQYLVGYYQSQGYRSNPGLGWIVLVGQPTSVALERASSLQQQITLWLLGLLAICGVLAGSVLRRFTQPLRTIAIAVDRVQCNDDDLRLPMIAGNNELARLTHSLNRLVDTLADQKQALRRSNEQLNIEIAARKQAEQGAQHLTERSAQIAQVHATFSAHLDLQSLLPTVAALSLEVLAAEATCVHLYQGQSTQFELAAAAGLSYNEKQALASIAACQEINTMRECLETRLNAATIAGSGWSVVPLWRGRRLLGIVSARRSQSAPVDPDYYELLKRIGDSAALAIANALSFEQARRRLQTVQALHAIDQAITSTQHHDDILYVTIHQTLEQLEAHAAIVWLYDEGQDEWRRGLSMGLRFPLHSALTVPSQRGLPAETLRSERHIDNDTMQALSANSGFAYWLHSEAIQSYFGVPLIAHGVVHGLLEVLHRTSFEPDKEWLDLLHTLADHLAIGLHHLKMLAGLQAANEALGQAYDTTIEGWSRALDLRDKETEGHSQRVTALTLELAHALHMSENELVHVRRGALLHDIGKMGIPDAILLKPGPLDSSEWAIMKRHPVYAYELLSPIAYLRPSLDIPYYHHEKWNGTGYPTGISGADIPLAARIFAIVDVFDALTHDRPYHRARPPEMALTIIVEQAGAHFDPAVVEAFLAVMEQQGLRPEPIAQNVGAN